LSGPADLDRRIEVRFQGFCIGCMNLAAIPLFYLLLQLPMAAAFVFLVILGLAIAYGLFYLLATFDRRPLMIVAPEGIYLPVAGDAFFRYDEIEVWAERVRLRREGEGRYDVFSLQGRPRVYLELGWWGWLREVRANTLLDGDLCFDERYIDINAGKLAAEIQARIDRATATPAA